MKGQQRPRSVRQQILMQRIGAELLLYDEARHMAFCLNATSRAVWSAADGERTVAQICEAASAELGQGVSEDLVYFAMAELRRDGLMETAALDLSDALPAISRRQMLQRLGVGGAMLLPVVAAIVAPKAAEAYSGCVDCTSNSQAARRQSIIRRSAGSAPQQ
jgi:hypothetical protein